ncbi:MAG TPA: DUF429 domain-containing protein [Thermoanaerobaculia bacterium]|nr:DUF429 domain-containing protein [Thermoanaerobaculia bacterium]
MNDPHRPSSPLVIGIDPAPKKPAAIWSEDGLTRLPPAALRTFLEIKIAGPRAIIIVWDSPLAFSPTEGFSDRPIDRAARAWRSEKVREGRIEDKAVAVRPFSGCPHWAISCHALGLPFGDTIDDLTLYAPNEADPKPDHGLVVEVHPAVALAALWIDRQIEGSFPRYKGSKAERGGPKAIAERLDFPVEASEDDDALDAFVAYYLGRQVARGESAVVGVTNRGSYLLPTGQSAAEISRRCLDEG